MPRPTDHHERRREVAALASTLIADGGTDAVTIRDVARKAGYSTAIVSHYFTDKHDLLLQTYHLMASRAAERLDRAVKRHPADTERCLSALLPVDEESRTEWKVWIAFWGKAVADPGLAGEQAAAVRESRARIVSVLESARESGQIPLETDVAVEARRLLSAVIGVATQAIFDPSDWPATRQRAVVKAALGPLANAETKIVPKRPVRRAVSS
jgi:AcrR family transcriptional regulator